MNVVNALIDRFSKQETLRKVTANFTWLLSERILLMVVTMVVGIYVARSLGPENYGVLSFAVSFVSLFSAMSTLGMNRVMVKELVNHEEAHNELMGTAVLLQLGGATLLFISVYTASQIMDTDAQERTIMYIIAAGTLITCFQPIVYHFQSQVLSKYEAISRTAAMIVLSAVKVILVVSGAPLIYLAFAYFLRSVTSSAFLLYFYHKKGGSLFKWKFDKKIAVGLFYDCWPIIISGLVVSVHMKIDQVMINQMLGSTEVGYYAAAAKLSEVWYFLPTIIVSSVYPILIKYKNRSDSLYKQQLRKLYDLMVVLSLSVAIPTTFLSGWVTDIIYGEEYIKTGQVLALHIWAGVFMFMGIVRGNWTVIEKQQKYNPIIQAGGAFFNIVFNFILIPIYGIMGAAIATLGTVAANLLITPVFINAKYREQVRLILGSLNLFMLIPRLFQYLKEVGYSKEVKS